MSKSILQEIATLNALEFNRAKTYSSIKKYTADLDKNSRQIDNTIAKLTADYKLSLLNYTEDFDNLEETLGASILQIEIDVDAAATFNSSQFAAIYKNLGKVDKRAQRAAIFLSERMDEDFRHPLSYFTGPIKDAVSSPTSGFRMSYTAVKLEPARNWLYFTDSNDLKYAGTNVLSLAAHKITLGDATNTKLECAGYVEIKKDLEMKTGKIRVVTPNNPNGPTYSFEGNRDIRSVLGGFLAKRDYKTVQGDFLAPNGKVDVKLNINTTDGDFLAPKGKALIRNSFQTTNGGFIGDHVSSIVSVKSDITTSNGEMEIKVAGNFKTASGGFTSLTNGYLAIGNGKMRAGYFHIAPDAADPKILSTIGLGGLSVAGPFTADKGFTAGGLTVTDGGGITAKPGSTSKFDTIEVAIKAAIYGLLNIGPDDNEWAKFNASLFYVDTPVKFKHASGLNITSGTLKVAGITTLSSSLVVNNTDSAAEAVKINGKLKVSSGGMDISGTSVISGTLNVSGKITAGSIKSNGNIDADGYTVTATLFDGEATSARYGDLAEIYTCAETFEPGTVVSIADSGDFDIVMYDEKLPLAGVVSTKPGMILNKQEDGLLIALKGKIPVNVDDDIVIKKGQYLFPRPNGTCYGVDKHNLNSTIDLIGVALSDSIDGQVVCKV